MSIINRLNDFGIKFQVKITDCTSGNNFDESFIAEQFLIFSKPEGDTFEKISTLVEEPESSGDFFITYVNTFPETESILDELGSWSYAGKIILSNNDRYTSSRKYFWVV